MGVAVVIKEEELRKNIQTVLSKLDKIESRVKNVEAVAAIVPKLEKKMLKIQSQVEERFEPVKVERKPLNVPSAPLPVKAFFGGASIGLMIVGAITAAWLLGFF